MAKASLHGFMRAGGMQVRAGVVTLVSGAATVTTDLKRAVITLSHVHASAAATTGLAVIGTLLEDSFVDGSSFVIESSSGSSTEDVFWIAVGF